MKRTDPVINARSAWGGEPPDWVLALAGACSTASQSSVAHDIRYSTSVVSQVIHNSYRGDLDSVEEAVRGALMEGRVMCPALGEIGGQVCVEHRRNAANWVNSNPQRRLMYRACRACPRYLKGAKS